MGQQITAKGPTFLLAASLGAASLPAAAVNIQIGDVDSFGFDASDPGLVNVDGDQVDLDGDGFIGVGEGLPDLNGGGAVAWNDGDNFDNRSATEAADPAALWTDVSLSLGFGDGPGEIDDISFTLDFAAPTPGGPDDVDHFLNILGGDIGEQGGADVTVDGNTTTLTTFSGAGAGDGGVTLTSVTIAAADLADGQLIFNFSGGDPYVAIDAMRLAPTQTAPEPVPAPPTLALLLGGALGLGGLQLRRRGS